MCDARYLFARGPGPNSSRQTVPLTAGQFVKQPIAARPLFSAAVFLMAGFVLTGILTWQILESLRPRAATETARSYVASMELVREYYTQEIVPRAGGRAQVSHAYTRTPGAIPMPATLSIELGQRMDDAGSPARMRFYSAWPYPYRADGGPRDAFEQRAVDTSTTADSPPIIQVEADLRGGILRYAEPVVCGPPALPATMPTRFRPAVTGWPVMLVAHRPLS